MEPENVLIHELKRGSCLAFNNIYKMYAGRLYSFCLKYIKNKEDVEEIVQDVFLKLWNSKETIVQEQTLKSLLFIMSKHLIINRMRRTINNPLYEEYVLHINDFHTEDASYCIEYEEFLRQVHSAISKLPVTQQKIIRLSKFELLTNKEIVERLNLNEQTVKNQLSLGLKSLKKIIHGQVLILATMLNIC